MAELLGARERAPRRRPELLEALKHIHSAAWPYLFGKPADDLQQAHAAADEFMIRDADLLVCRFISVPKSYASFVPGSLVAGIVRGMLDAAGLPARCVHAACGMQLLQQQQHGAAVVPQRLTPLLLLVALCAALQGVGSLCGAAGRRRPRAQPAGDDHPHQV